MEVFTENVTKVVICNMSWSEAVLASYRDDLAQAAATGRNLLTEKYARMMKATSPYEYALIAHLLPEPSPEVLSLIDRIVEVVLAWEDELSAKYPNILKRGRALRSSQDSLFISSLETYLRGELATYSTRTLGLYCESVTAQRSQGINGSEVILGYLMNRYGFHSLHDANERLGARSG